MNEEQRIQKQYLLDIMTGLKQVEKQRIQYENDLEVWVKRVELATSRGEIELAAKAGEKVDEIKTIIQTLKKEENNYKNEALKAQADAPVLENTMNESVNTDLLIEEMKILTGGEPDTTAEAMKEFEADEALEKLKRKMQEKSE